MRRDGDPPPEGRRGGIGEIPFRISKAARTLAWRVRRAFTDETAWALMKAIRFRDNDGKFYCPTCGSTRHYAIKSRLRRWSCAQAGCRK